MSRIGTHVLEQESAGRLVWNDETGQYESTKEDND